MHASIWHFRGDPDDLLARYDAMRVEIPDERLHLHACLRAGGGLIIVDACPTKEAYDAFVASEWLTDLLVRHGLPAPELADYPVHAAFAGGRPVAP